MFCPRHRQRAVRALSESTLETPSDYGEVLQRQRGLLCGRGSCRRRACLHPCFGRAGGEALRRFRLSLCEELSSCGRIVCDKSARYAQTGARGEPELSLFVLGVALVVQVIYPASTV